ncbi:MAG: glycosyltransferase family 9 protein [Crocinitomicaceae bacterium]|nr:glycosyltransferase family 9 protein [Crocinitomicaceae bacterium]
MEKIFCISRTDSIGDVVLTLPMVCFLKKNYPESKIIFLGKTYTKSIIQLCSSVDEILLFDEMEHQTTDEIAAKLSSLRISHFIHVFPNKKLAKAAKQAKIPHRIGTSHRLFHWLTCNEKVDFTRKNSELHESQLNFKLLKPLGIEVEPSLEEVTSYLACMQVPKSFDFDKFSVSKALPLVILHPKSQGSAVEWGIDNFMELALKLKELPVEVLICGTENESKEFREQIPSSPKIKDLSGQLTLVEYISLINESHVLVAASTGPLHIAGVLGKTAIGLYSSRKPIHPGRWKPIGKKAQYLVYNENCTDCSSGKICSCIQNIHPEKVMDMISAAIS